ncbi:MAG: molecular chaperone DnaJ, partial [Cyanobacteria bacterium J06649_11]
MEINETIAKIKSQLEKIEGAELANQQEQKQVTELILNLETELKELQTRRSRLDEEALQLHAKAEELRPKLDKLD